MRAKTLHSAGCDVWDLPAQPAVPEGGVSPEATTAYLAAVAPVYAALSRVTAQLGGLLLLSLHRGADGLQLDHTLHRSARDRLAEAEDRLSAVRVPAEAARHAWVLGRAVKTLRQALLGLEWRPAEAEPIRLLHAAHELLRLAARPREGLCLIDFEQACCSCAGRGAGLTGRHDLHD